jgi:hypothetical protein
MLTEDYNGVCPKCGFERCLVRYGSYGWYQFFACPDCGLAIDSEGQKDEKVWHGILKAEEHHLIEDGFEVSRKGVKDWLMSKDEPTDKFKIEIDGKHWRYWVEVKNDVHK